jgi:acetoin:2,6-dichlorophenolindophenol oxidoreductase subunit alpha
MTYRWYDHMNFAGAKLGQDGSFGLAYRSDDEMKAWMARDPIVRYKAFLTDRKIATADELANLDKDIQAAVDASWDFARKAPPVKPEDGLLMTYANSAVEATQFYDRKGLPVAWEVPDYMKGHAAKLGLEA